MTIQSDGAKQKVMLVVLLMVMFSSLSGVNLSFVSAGQLGDFPANLKPKINLDNQ